MTPMQRRWVATVMLGTAGGIDLLFLNVLAAPAWVRESQAAVPPTTLVAAVAPPASIPPVATAPPAAPLPNPPVRPQQPPSAGPIVQDEPRFGVYSAELDPRSQAVLLSAFERIAAVQERTVLLRGHTDQRGDERNNDQLSLQRASAAREFLVSAGVPRTRIAIEGAGARQPVDSADTPEARARNRRVEILWQP